MIKSSSHGGGRLPGVISVMHFGRTTISKLAGELNHRKKYSPERLKPAAVTSEWSSITDLNLSAIEPPVNAILLHEIFIVCVVLVYPVSQL